MSPDGKAAEEGGMRERCGVEELGGELAGVALIRSSFQRRERYDTEYEIGLTDPIVKMMSIVLEGLARGLAGLDAQVCQAALTLSSCTQRRKLENRCPESTAPQLTGNSATPSAWQARLRLKVD